MIYVVYMYKSKVIREDYRRLYRREVDENERKSVE